MLDAKTAASVDSKQTQPIDVRPFCFHELRVEQDSNPVHEGERWTEEDIHLREESAYMRGLQEGESRARSAHKQALDVERSRISQMLEGFAEERQEYFRRLEQQVVDLSLGIARKILEREARFDPLLLKGAVRVALDHLNENTKVIARVAPSQAREWREAFAMLPGRRSQPEVREEDGLSEDCCLLETESGEIEISIDRRLEEVESTVKRILAKRVNGDGNVA